MRSFHLLNKELKMLLKDHRLFFYSTEIYYKNGKFVLLSGEQVNLVIHSDDYQIKMGGRITCGK